MRQAGVYLAQRARLSQVFASKRAGTSSSSKKLWLYVRYSYLALAYPSFYSYRSFPLPTRTLTACSMLRYCAASFDSLSLYCQSPGGGMADAEDLKSSGDFSSCGFDSHPGHQTFPRVAVSFAVARHPKLTLGMGRLRVCISAREGLRP